jgi:cysteine desulfurase
MVLHTPIYLDHNATTPVDPRVLERLVEVQREHFGNPASSSHAYGWAAARLVEEAREEVARLIGATSREIVFTSGATESNNLALKGVAARYAGRGDHCVTTNLEHEAVAAPLGQLQRQGWRVTCVAAAPDGRVDPAAIADAVTDRTVLISVIAAQNEIGTLQPLREIGAICKERGVLFHTDAAQAAGKVELDVVRDGVDLLSLSGNKIYAPKGVGALYVRRRDPRVALEPQVTGGGQERGLRAGSLNVPGIVALGEACRLAQMEMPVEAARLLRLRERLRERLMTELGGVHLNGSVEHRLPGNLNLSFESVMAHRLLGALTVLAISSSSACSSAESQASPILAAIGVPRELAMASVRIGLGRGTTEEEIDFAAAKIIAAVTQLRREHPAGTGHTD